MQVGYFVWSGPNNMYLSPKNSGHCVKRPRRFRAHNSAAANDLQVSFGEEAKNFTPNHEGHGRDQTFSQASLMPTYITYICLLAALNYMYLCPTFYLIKQPETKKFDDPGDAGWAMQGESGQWALQAVGSTTFHTFNTLNAQDKQAFPRPNARFLENKSAM